jgi:hypothetical protein
VAVATPASQSVASKASWWLLAAFIVATLLALAWASLFTLGFVNTQYGNYPVENFTLNVFVWLAAVAMLAVQSTAFAGLYMRRHWGRTVATIAAGLWVFTVIGIPFAAVTWWVLHRRWDPGVDSTFDKDHPSAPAYVLGLCAVGTAIVLVWVWFLYFHLVGLLIQLSPSQPASGWYWIASVALYLSIPLWVVQGLAFVGLRQKHDWGAVLALITCVLWVVSGVGLPFGIPGLIVLWRWQHPALKRLAASGAPA